MLEQAGVLALGVVQQHAVVDVVRHLVSSAAETINSFFVNMTDMKTYWCFILTGLALALV